MSRTILLVDDEAGIRNTLSLLLEDMGYHVVTAENGNNALDVFGRTRPPVVLTDIKMPGLDGIGLLKRIKKEHPDTEVIMMTGHGDVELAVESLKNEATDFITKPILSDAVEIALDRAFKRIDDREQLREYTRNLEAMVEEKSRRLVEAERLNAVGQAVEGLASAIMGLPGDLNDELSYFNDLPCFVSLHNRDLEVLTANQTYYERIGAHREGRSWDLYTGGAGTPDNCPVAITFRTEKGLRSAETLLVADRQVPVVVFTTPVRDQHQKVALVIEFMVDVSEISRLQEAFQYARERYHQLFNEVPCYITVHDPYLRITEANRLFRETFGEGIGEHCYSIYKHRTKPCKNCPVVKTFEDGRTHSEETVVTAANGERYNVLVYTSPIRDRDGNITRVMEMSTDITQIHQLRDQLSSLGLLIGSISHGIKGMLTGLDGGVYMLNSGFKKNDRDLMEEGWETVQTMIKRIREMILNILFYAKEREVSPEKTDLRRFLKEVADAFAPKCTKENIAFTADIDPRIGFLELDGTAVRAALANIIENAIDACKADSGKPEHRIGFRAERGDDGIVIEISDNGPGMDPETVSQMFTLFYTSKGNRGTGLGLFVSKKTVEKHGGKIEVDSEVGQGTAFRITLPEKQADGSETGDRDTAEKSP